jgi:hypothetical protein
MCHLTIQNATVYGKLPDAKKAMSTGKTTPPMNIVTLRPTRRFGQLPWRVGQNRFAVTYYGENGLRERRRLSIPPPPSPENTHIFGQSTFTQYLGS